MISFTVTSQNEPSPVNTFSRWEVAFYIRDLLLQDFEFPDPSLVDALIDATWVSLPNAALACALVRFGPEQSAHHRLSILLGYPPLPYPVLASDTFYDSFGSFGAEESVELKNATSFDARMKIIRNSPKLGDTHGTIAYGCLHVMNTLLRFNICSISSSYSINNSYEVFQLFESAQRKGHITPALLYACSHWSYHASFVPSDQNLVKVIMSFLECHVLHWLEILILVGQKPLTTVFQLRRLVVSKRHLSSCIALLSHDQLLRVKDLSWTR